ncbi:MAG TPA: ABC transporter permease subunit [Candidatus Hydrogenedens sp.]|nr:ABC transporter permease subunit [Candidatus Hydrogenedens sp.]HPP60059.1 ABC transporter permease subunit [Candidatus Hydrogenedens sp.]
MNVSNKQIIKIWRWFRFGIYHCLLLLGAIMFSAPFVWLIGTSFKSPDELYPPSWFPPIPAHVITSPYFGANANELPIQPVDVDDERWKTFLEIGRDAVKQRLYLIKNDIPEFIKPYLNEPTLTDVILGSLFRRMPKELWSDEPEKFSTWISNEINMDTVINNFDIVYRRVAVGELLIKTWDAETFRIGDAETLQWHIYGTCAQLVPRLSYFSRKGIEIHYDFSKSSEFTIETVADCNISAEDFKKLRLGLRGDKSWFTVLATIDIGGKRFQSTEAVYLQYDQWQDCLWQVASDEDKSIMMKSWYTEKQIGDATETPKDKIRLRLHIKKISYPMVLARKAWGNYREVLREIPLKNYVYNSLFLVVMNIIGQVFSASFVAYAFARLRWPGRDYYFILILATLMIPAQVTLVPAFLIWKTLGLYNTLVPLWASSFFGNAFFIFLLRQFMLSIPRDLEDSALIDGCSYLGIYRHVILPLIKPALATVAIFTFLWVWNDFMGPLVFLTDQEKYPLSLGLFALHAMLIWFARFELMMSASVLMTLPVIALFFFAQRQFIQGITLTGMKG